MSAARWGNTDIVAELVKGGADIHMQNKVCCLLKRSFIDDTDIMDKERAEKTDFTLHLRIYVICCLFLTSLSSDY